MTGDLLPSRSWKSLLILWCVLNISDSVHIYMYMYTTYTCVCTRTWKNTVMVGPDKPAIPGQRLYILVSSQQEEIRTHNLSGMPLGLIGIHYGEPHVMLTSRFIATWLPRNTCLTKSTKTRLTHDQQYVYIHVRLGRLHKCVHVHFWILEHVC